LDRKEKDSGALLIDIGGGTTDYVLYLNGAIAASGCIPLGGDHISNDIHLLTHIPFTRAEELKKTEGDASGDPARGIGKVKVLDDNGCEEMEIERELLNGIIHSRLKEILTLVVNRLPENALRNIGDGIYITGGTSRMRGLYDLAEQIFPGIPIYQAEQSDQTNVSGVHANFRDPQYTTAVGLIRYAQILDAEREAGPKKSKIAKFFRALWPFG
jgi:cell division protein FtsA